MLHQHQSFGQNCSDVNEEQFRGLDGKNIDEVSVIIVLNWILLLADILVDGRFEEEKKQLGLRFRGSSNQRIIDMNKTRAAGEIVIWEGCKLDKSYSAPNKEND